MQPATKDTSLYIQLQINPSSKAEFLDWQARLNAEIAIFPGFVSLEILSPSGSKEDKWAIVQRFDTSDAVAAWKISKEWSELKHQLKSLLKDDSQASLHEIESSSMDKQGGVTEVFVTQVSPDKEELFRKWIAKMHQVEATFPGFKGMYVQSPSTGHIHHNAYGPEGQSRNWITLLQFDTPENLDRWLSSAERQEILRESQSMISSLESHRVISPYAGWFSSFAKEHEMPSVWKQTMLILLVLFPIVMLEIKFLNPLTAGLNISLATFIGNAISVSLVSYPFLPFAIRSLGWWLSPEPSKRFQINLMGTLLVSALYVLEIIILWKLV